MKKLNNEYSFFDIMRLQQYQCGTDPPPEQESDQDWRIWLVPTLETIEEENRSNSFFKFR